MELDPVGVDQFSVRGNDQTLEGAYDRHSVRIQGFEIRGRKAKAAA